MLPGCQAAPAGDRPGRAADPHALNTPGQAREPPLPRWRTKRCSKPPPRRAATDSAVIVRRARVAPPDRFTTSSPSVPSSRTMQCVFDSSARVGDLNGRSIHDLADSVIRLTCERARTPSGTVSVSAPLPENNPLLDIPFEVLNPILGCECVVVWSALRNWDQPLS